MDELVPKAHQDAAERIRLHLVSLRGGAPFLSPTDTALLVDWLDASLPVPTILAALERAAEKRHARRVRAPLMLTHARRYVRSTPPLAAAPPTHWDDRSASPFANVITRVEALGAPAEALGRLAAELTAIDTTDVQRAVVFAIDAARRFFDAIWQDNTDAGRTRFLAQAETDLEDVLGLLDEHERAPLVEQHGRALLRARYPQLSAATLTEQVSG